MMATLFDKTDYNADQIQVLKGLEAVRKRPGMYIGSTGIKGLHHLVWEVVDNSIDEFLAGYGEEIKVTIHENNEITVEDYGRGIPADIHKDSGLPAVQVVLTTLHAGGKFNNNSYKVSGGLHGVGVSVVNALSEKLVLTTHWEGNKYRQEFKKGIPTSKLKKIGQTERSGTVIRFKADRDIFAASEYKFENLAHRLQESAYLNKDLSLILIDQRGEEEKKEVFQYDGGIKAFVEYLNRDRNVINDDIIYFESKPEDYEVEMAIQYNDGYNERIYSYANNINTVDGGYHLTGFKTALTRAINNFAKNNNRLPAKISSLRGKDVREGITAIINVKLPEPQFEGQTKTKLGNSELRSIVESEVYEYLSLYFDTNPELANKVIDKAVQAVRARKASKKARELTKRKSALNSNALPGKLADCSSQKAEKSELFIVEGDSAGGSAKQGRDRNFQAILPLKGKILNVERARLDKILNNTEIASIITALGAGIGEDFKLKNLRYHKIIIMTDADVDGSHIATLVLTFFFRYMKELIELGYIYVATPPLYLIKKGKEAFYCWNEEERKEVVKKLTADGKESGLHLQRYKGLGEMNEEQLWDTTMRPERRKLRQVDIENAAEANRTFSMLMGDEVPPRREFIEKNARYANIDI